MGIQNHPTGLHRISHPEQGAALIISLILLIAITFMGIASMDATRIETLMGQNTQFSVNAMSNAEQVLKSAEIELDTIVNDDATLAFEREDDHYYYPILTDDPDPALNNWSFSHASITGGSYFVEYWGSRPLSGESTQMGESIAGSSIHLFQISARSETGKGAKRTVQSIYVTNSAP